MAKRDYNLIVIGGGSAGLSAAYVGAVLKARVALIEKHKMGGDCLNTGCVPSKALLRTAKILSYIRRHREFGIRSATAEVDFAAVMERVRTVIGAVAPHDSVERYTSLGVDCIQGEAHIVSRYAVRVGTRTLTANNIIVATGSRPLVPPIPGLQESDFLTTDTVWDLRENPGRLLVAGGGPVGCELAQAFSRLGCRVTILEMALNLLPREDAEYGNALAQRFTAEGIDARTATTLKEVFRENGAHVALVETAGHPGRVEFDRILLALGRTPNVKGFGLEEVGVQLDPRGAVAVDECLRTRVGNIYACGDVAGPYPFTHTAGYQAWHCAVNALFSPFKKFKVDYRVIPWCTFTDPEVARVGLSETEARQQGIAYEVSRYKLDDLDRAIADGEACGEIKILTAPGGKDRVLGVTIFGYRAGEMIAEYVSAMKHDIGLNDILGTIHIYPTMTEGNKYAAGVWKKNHAPERLLKWIKRFHAWRR
jgi:pyruvate/2-oxoglutarate dehydrogenase complex dihydrolipoamide dehydrogenase (E3) component